MLFTRAEIFSREFKAGQVTTEATGEHVEQTTVDDIQQKKV